MTAATVLRAADRTVLPWKNGGGETIEIAVFPPGSNMDEFEWRISMASVEVAGRFSHFGEIDRVLAVVAGQLELAFDDGPEPVLLDSLSIPHSFPGDTGVTGTPKAGAVRDINLMMRRGRWSGAIERLTPRETAAIVPKSDHVFVLFTGEGSLRFRGSDPISAQPLDVIRLDRADNRPMTIACEQDIYVISLFELLQ